MLESLAAANVILATNTGEGPGVHRPACLSTPWRWGACPLVRFLGAFHRGVFKIW